MTETPNNDVALHKEENSDAMQTDDDTYEAFSENHDDGSNPDEQSEDGKDTDQSGQHAITCKIESFEKVLDDGRVLIKYNGHGNTGYGIIDQEQNIMPLYLDENGLIQEYIPEGKKIAVYIFDVLPNGNYFEAAYDNDLEDGGFHIYDATGQILYQTPDKDGAVKIVGAYEDKVLVLQHISNFSENVWKLFMMDQKGSRLSAEYDVSDHYKTLYDGLTDYNCGMLITDSIKVNALTYHIGIFNMQTGNYFIVDRWLEYGRFAPGENAALWYSGESNHHYVVKTDYLANEETYNRWFEKKRSLEEIVNKTDGKGQPDHFNANTAGEGKVCLSALKEFYTVSGDYVCSVPAFGENVNIIEIGRFSGGFAPVILKGADNYFYVTIIDQEGKPQYNPIKLKNVGVADEWGHNTPGLRRKLYNETESASSYSDVFFDGGYIFCSGKDGHYLIDPEGNEIILPKDLKYSYGLRNGCICFRNSFIRVNDPDHEITEGYLNSYQ